MNKRTRTTKPQGEASRAKIMEYLISRQVKVAPVSLREIASGVDLSLSAVNTNIGVLINQGRIRRNGTVNIEVLEPPIKLSEKQKKDRGLQAHAKLLEIREASKSVISSIKVNNDKNRPHYLSVFSVEHPQLFEDSIVKLDQLFKEYEALR